MTPILESISSPTTSAGPRRTCAGAEPAGEFLGPSSRLRALGLRPSSCVLPLAGSLKSSKFKPGFSASGELGLAFQTFGR